MARERGIRQRLEGARALLHHDLVEGRPDLLTFLVRREGQTQPKQEPEAKDEPSALPADIHAKVELAASQGTTTFRAWWKSDEAKEHRVALTRNLEPYQDLCDSADKKGAPTEEDPFSGGAPERELGEEG